MKEQASFFQPVRVLETELSEPLPTLKALKSPSGRTYRQFHVLLRLHSRPLGVVELNLPGEILPAEAYAAEICQSLRDVINVHLRDDGLPEMETLTATGLPTSGTPCCVRKREQFLTTAPLVSVVVCTRDRTEELQRCLAGLLLLDYPRYEIVVVDNAPRTTATADMIRQRFARESKLFCVREDRPGLSWARNCGLQHAQGEFVAYTDDDAVADRHWLAELISGFYSAENIGCVTGSIVPGELETPAQVWFEEFGGLCKARGFASRYFNLFTHRPYDPLFPYLTSKFGAGVNMAFRTSVLRLLGGFDPTLGSGTPAYGGDDFEKFFQVIMHGYTLVFQPAALMRHFHRRDTAKLRQHLYGCGIAFTAYLTRCMVDDPKCVIDLLSRAPHALHYLFNPASVRNERKRRDFPKDLTRRELQGMLVGPLAYLQSRRAAGKIAKQFGPLEVHER